MCRREFVSDDCNRGTAGELGLGTELEKRKKMNETDDICRPICREIVRPSGRERKGKVCEFICSLKMEISK